MRWLRDIARWLKLRAAVAQAISLLRLPPTVLRFYVRALWRAWRTGDRTSPRIAAHPRELEPVLRAAGNAECIVEIGTGTAWTAIALTLARPGREVISLDVWDRPERDRYLALAPADARERLRLVSRAGEDGPDGLLDTADFVFVDSSHTREETLKTFETWSPCVRPGGAVAFHDYGNAEYPGVADAISELGLQGEESHLLFVWRKPHGVDGSPQA